jgi:signal transduction histidine kinase
MMKNIKDPAKSKTDDIAWSLLEIRAEALIYIDKRGTILLANQPAAKYYSKPVEELVGTCLWDLTLPARANYLKILLSQAAHDGAPITVKQQDDVLWRRTLIQPIPGEEGRPDKFALCTWDITPLIEAQEKYKRAALALINAQEEERHRISRDLHDDIGQRMTALALSLHAMESALGGGKSITINEVRNAIRDLETITKQTRQIFYQLHPPSLSTVAFPKLLEAFCASVEYSSVITVDFNCQEDIPELSDLQTTVLYRFVQEGFANVIKHAAASRAWINFDFSEGDLNISIEDDGKGFLPTETQEGLGLSGLRERFQMMDGSIEVESAPGKGTRLFGTLPVIYKENRG